MMLRIHRKYDYLHLLVTSEFDLRINKVVISPDLSSYGRKGWEMTKVIPTEKDGVYDIFFKRTAGFVIQLYPPAFLRRGWSFIYRSNRHISSETDVV